MIEWLVLGALALAGGASSSGSRSSSSGSRSTTSFDTGEYRRKKAADEAAWRAGWEHEVDRTRWIPQSVAHRIIETYPLPGADRTYFMTSIEKPAKLKELLAEFAAHNLQHLAERKAALKPFFDSVEKNPLTDEQMDACICFDDAVQIVAAAGSGKTSTMVAKAGYALHEGLVAPEQILVLAFNRDAAKELDARIQTRLAQFEGVDRITARTFSAFGLSLIGEATGRRPSLAPWVGSQTDEVAKIVEIVEDLRRSDPTFREDWDVFRTVYGRDLDRWSAPRDSANPSIVTTNGERVKSDEERIIANWLFHHGVSYEYERPYEYDTVTSRYGQYKPDFYYSDVRLYHEHFALNRKGMPPPHFEGDYLGERRWKQGLHEERGTDLFETTSHEIRSPGSFDRLRHELESRGLSLHHDPDRTGKGPPPPTISQLASTLRTFQQHVKGSGLTIAQIRAAIPVGSDDAYTARLTRFVDLYERISAEWEERLRAIECIDFDDMIVAAAEHLEAGYESPYTLILADEFQDSSRGRVRLLKALLKSRGHDARLCVVGDDWQGINRFAGADLSVMSHFKASFEHSTRVMLSTTFRCPAALSEAASAFVQANPRQISKTVVTTNEYDGPALVAYASETSEASTSLLRDHLDALRKQVASGALHGSNGHRPRVMVLGRYNRDRPADIGRWQRSHASAFDLEFRTVHASKGLEADYVMLVNLTEGLMGFPAKQTDDSVLDLAMPEPDPFPMSEERRLFYVALTRAKRQVRMYTTIGEPSRFLMELANGGHLRIRTTGGLLEPCPSCRSGHLKLIEGRNGTFQACSRSPSCRFKRNVAVRSGSRSAGNDRIEAPMEAGCRCPICGTGTLILRDSGPYDPFLGCSEYPRCRARARPLEAARV
ncbi:UvrD-helicase domain-containing protein [Sphingomonas aracearum]|uniref:DNA 3'-5' helicase n=1 Tax=Sphingomonas aracearum TaxID=2283317 RepID=A0A369VYC4_9SPHN|nr:UvrD-helicase domain-containing protein [Sphingomonas aracearum]RDE06627.1 helicase IV [Sphingomonas aracearum]